MKKLVLAGLLFGSTLPAHSQAVAPITAPTVPALSTLSVGSSGTLNQTVSSGSKASLSFGSSTSFGASANLSGTSGTATQVKSRVKLKDLDIANEDSTAAVVSDNPQCPTGNCISTTLGTKTTADGITTGVIDAKISNLRANNLTSDLTETDNSNYTNGNAELGGVQASNDLVLDGLESDFSVATRTVHVGATDQNEPDQVINVGTDEAPVLENQLSNGSASAVVNSQTTVDINTNQFVSTFQQAY